MKKIGILTRDCAGMNAVIRSVVRSACIEGLEVLGIRRGFEGLIDGDIQVLNHRAVSGIINLGGTILKTARSTRFRTKAGILKALKTIKENKIDGLIVAGGNGSLTGAHQLAAQYSVPVIGIPSTIDNDVNGVAMTIGADTAVNVALDAIDKIRDTATSLERIFVVEVMGRDCGYIALRVALAGGCEDVILPEKRFNIKKICNEIVQANSRGKISWIIIVAEGKAKAIDVSKDISKVTGLETREVVLGHIQRGGRPTAYDRILAARYANYAVKILKDGESDKCVTLNNDKLTSIPLALATQPKDSEVNDYYKLIKILT
ncbi:MAG: 6-phosphofructokinase [Candidatus Omnitrophica bacterium]|nr:6-phosphofructokinase [Candidatus Omnitrophota bacterium]MCK5288463.1 6-phosphofructokinase [Candidatus Omnitrophota bacterium]